MNYRNQQIPYIYSSNTSGYRNNQGNNMNILSNAQRHELTTNNQYEHTPNPNYKKCENNSPLLLLQNNWKSG